MSAGVSIRALSTAGETREAAALIDRIWGERRILTPELLLATTTHGGLVMGAFRGERMIGAQMGFLGLLDSELVLHSHVTGIDPDEQRSGVGFAMKLAQRRWCLERGIGVVTWTFDPMIARNAHFNLRKLGAIAVGFLRDFYGPMADAFNAGERTDRLEARWELRSARVVSALEGRAADAGNPGARLLVRVPEDYLALRAADPDAARSARDQVADELESAMSDGLVAVDFLPEHAYVLVTR